MMEEIRFCGECESEYVDPVKCPVCRYRETAGLWKEAVRGSERYRATQDNNTSGALRSMNQLASEGWQLVHHSAMVVPESDGPDGAYTYYALFERPDYDATRHLFHLDTAKRKLEEFRHSRRMAEAHVRKVRNAQEQGAGDGPR